MASTQYYPKLLDVRCEEISNALYDIYKMCESIMFLFWWTNDMKMVHAAIHILFTFNVYLTALMESHPELRVNKYKLQNMWKV